MHIHTMIKKIKESYSTKLILIFTMLNLLSILLISILFYFMLYATVCKNYERVTQDVSAQIHAEINRKLDEITRIANLYIFDQNFYNTVRKKYDGLERQNVLNDYLLTKGNTSLVLSDLPLSIKLYLDNTTIPEHYYTDDPENTRPNRVSFEVMHLTKIEDTDYYKKFDAGDKNMVVAQVDTDSNDGRISILAKIMNFTTGQSVGMIRIRVGLQDLFGDAVQENIKQVLNYDVTDSAGRFMYRYDQGYKTKKSDFTAEQTIENWGFDIHLSMPQENISNGFWMSYLNIIIAAVVCFGLMFAFASIFKKHLYGDISKILKGIDEFQVGNYEHNIETIGNDEFAQIATSLNKFAHSTGHLVNDVYEVMIQKQDLEFQMLQAKVNPHFLYNIFSIISQMAKAGKDEEIVRIVDKTAKFYRSALSKKSENGTIKGELEILRQYLEIIEIQRPGAVKLELFVEEEVRNCEIPSFTFQPIVENSIKHAMIDGKIVIRVKAAYQPKTDMVEIVISDNGAGMSEEQIKEMFLLRENRGYGLYNINERIRLRYPDGKYDIRCESEPMRGTDIILTIPFELQEEEAY